VARSHAQAVENHQQRSLEKAAAGIDQACNFFLAQNLGVGLPPWVRQTVKTQFAVRCKFLDRQDHFNAF
jgi:hypothetical protein